MANVPFAFLFAFLRVSVYISWLFFDSFLFLFGVGAGVEGFDESELRHL